MMVWVRTRWALLTIVFLALGSLWFAHLAAFHAWAGRGPPSRHPEWHLQWAGRFSGLACFCFVSGPWLWVVRRRSQRAA